MLVVAGVGLRKQPLDARERHVLAGRLVHVGPAQRRVHAQDQRRHGHHRGAAQPVGSLPRCSSPPTAGCYIGTKGAVVAILGAEVNVRQGWASVSAFAVVRRLSRRLNARMLKPSMADWLAYLTCV